jgi:spermidine/putrescine-binding protein
VPDPIARPDDRAADGLAAAPPGHHVPAEAEASQTVHDHPSLCRTVGRRRLLQAGAAASTVAAAGRPVRGRAEEPTPIDTMIVNAVLTGALREAIQKEANCIINDAPFQTSTDTVARLNAPGGTSRYDLMGSSYEFSRQPILGVKPGTERVLALDLSLIPNYGKIVPAGQQGIGKRDDKVYMIPFGFGFDSVVFNRDHVPEDDPYTQSWGALFEDKYAGRIGWYDVAVLIMCAAGLYLGHPVPYKMDKSELEDVIRFLSVKKKNVRSFFTTTAQAVHLMMTGEIYCAYGTLPTRAQLAQQGLNVGYAFPKEGVMSLINDVYIPKDAKNPRVAHAVINAMLGEAYAQQLSKVSGYLSASSYGPEMMSPADRKTYGYGVLDGTVKHVGEYFPDNINIWIEGWARIKSA